MLWDVVHRYIMDRCTRYDHRNLFIAEEYVSKFLHTCKLNYEQAIYDVFIFNIASFPRAAEDNVYNDDDNMNKFALLWGEAQLCLPYIFAYRKKVMTYSDDPKMTYSYPKVTYSDPKVTYSYPKVIYSGTKVML